MKNGQILQNSVQSSSYPKAMGVGGLFHSDLRGQIILTSPIPLEGVCRRLSARHTSVVMKSQALGNGRKPNSSILHLLGDDAAHRYILVKEQQKPSPPP